jgi:hypothetical protein
MRTAVRALVGLALAAPLALGPVGVASAALSNAPNVVVTQRADHARSDKDSNDNDSNKRNKDSNDNNSKGKKHSNRNNSNGSNNNSNSNRSGGQNGTNGTPAWQLYPGVWW